MPRPVIRARFAPLRRPSAVLLASTLTIGMLTAGVLTAVAGSESASSAATPAAATAAARKAKKQNVVTPGNFTGYGFDQCHAPSQKAMNRWRQSSPFFAVGIYIDGASRACREQPNLTPTWVSKQLAKGWRLLPITLGPQASCQPRFPRYGNDPTISPRTDADGNYSIALQQGIDQATSSVAVAGSLGIIPGSTLWYDLEGFNINNRACRESALSFLSGWSQQIRALGYVSGVYSSAGSGIKALDDARVNRPKKFALPDQIWIARWDGIANTSTGYIREDGWRPHARIKQYQGGHDERWGGVTINIDRNFLDLGTGSVAEREVYCGGVRLMSRQYAPLRQPVSGGYRPKPRHVKALQCLLQQQGLYAGTIHGRYNKATIAAANAWQSQHGMKVRPRWSMRNWVALLSAGDTPVVKFGSTGPAVRRLQRALVATGRPGSAAVRASGVFEAKTERALRSWQRTAKVEVSGVAGKQTWTALQSGRR